MSSAKDNGTIRINGLNQTQKQEFTEENFFYVHGAIDEKGSSLNRYLVTKPLLLRSALNSCNVNGEN